MLESFILQQSVWDPSPYFTWAAVGIIIALFGIVWKESKDRANMNNAITNLQLQLGSLKEHISSKSADLRVEHKEDIGKFVIDEANRMIEIQKQLDSLKSEMKDVNTRVTVVDTIVKGHTMGLKATHRRITETQNFFTDWIQRVEDRVEKGIDRCTSTIGEAERRLMGVMNMLINASGRRTR